MAWFPDENLGTIIYDQENLESDKFDERLINSDELQGIVSIVSNIENLANFLSEHDLSYLLPKLMEEELTYDILKEMTIEDLRMSELKAGSAWKLLKALQVCPQNNKEKVTEILSCTSCDQVFTTLQYLECHSYNWDKELTINTSQAIDMSIVETFKCDKCIFHTISKTDLKKHIFNEHETLESLGFPVSEYDLNRVDNRTNLENLDLSNMINILLRKYTNLKMMMIMWR